MVFPLLYNGITGQQDNAGRNFKIVFVKEKTNYG